MGPEFAYLGQLADRLGEPLDVQKNAHLMRLGDPFNHLHLVQSGSFKAYVVDFDGREHVMGFFLPGEVMGFDAIQTGKYRANFSAQQDARVSVIPYEALSQHLEHIPGLVHGLVRLMSENLARIEALAGDHTADERVAAFVNSMARRMGDGANRARRFVLPMSRADIGNFLRLAPETVTRVLARFSKEGLIATAGHQVTVLDPARLRDLGRNLESF